MTEIEAIRARHSVRTYREQRIDGETVRLLEEKISELNEKGNLHLQFMEDAGNTYNKLLNRAMGLGSAPSVIACVGEEAPDLEERIGYYGEQLVLYAQQIGLNTCWAGTFNKKNIGAEVRDGERLVISIAIGYGDNPGRQRKSKTAEQVASGTESAPEWFKSGVEAALLAPTAINQQKFEIAYHDGEVTFEDKGGVFSQVDLGIVKYHFEVGAAAAEG